MYFGGSSIMKKIGLTVYGISVQDDQNQRKDLNDIINKKSLIDIIERYANNKGKKYSHDEEREVIFSFDKIEVETILDRNGKEKFDILYGRVKTGEYGIESELVNIDTGDIYNRATNQADTMPFGFALAIPKGKIDNSIIVLQSIGSYGMKVALQKELISCIKEVEQSLKIELGQIVPKTYIDRLFKDGALQKIRMIRYEIPEDISERMGINYGVKQTREERVIYKPMGFIERKRRMLSEWIRGQRSYTDIIEIEDFKYDDLKLEFKLGRTNKTVSLKDINNLTITEDITDEVVQEGGHPEFESLKKIMKTILEEYLIAKGLLEKKE